MAKAAPVKRLLAAFLCAMLTLGSLLVTALPAHAAEPIVLSGNTYTSNPGENFIFDVSFTCDDCPNNGGETCYVRPGTDDKGHSFEINSFTYSISKGVCKLTISASGSSCNDSNLTWNRSVSFSYDCAEVMQKPNIQGFLIACPDDSKPGDPRFYESIVINFRRAVTKHQGDATCITEAPCALCGKSYTDPESHDQAPSCVPTDDKSKHVASYPCCETVATEEHVFGATGFCACGVENIAPAGTITIAGSRWSESWSAATPWGGGPYRPFFKDKAGVTIEADGTGSQVARVEYLFSETALDAGNLPTSGWTTLAETDGKYSFSIESQSKGAVYVLITDECGNQALINSESFVVYSDSVAIANEVTYIRGSGENPVFEIDFNGNEVANVTQGGSYLGATECANTSVGLELDSYFIENAPLGDDPVFTVYLNPLGEPFAYEGIGFGEPVETEGDVPNALTLTLHIRDAWVPTENVEGVKGVTPENVKPEDRDDLERAKQDLEAALADEGKNYDDESKSAIEEDLARVDEALKVLEDVENVEGLINALPEIIAGGDAAAVKQAADAYAALTEHGKSLVSEDAKAKLAAAEEVLEKALEAEKSLIAATGDSLPTAFAVSIMLIGATGVLVAHRKMRGAL